MGTDRDEELLTLKQAAQEVGVGLRTLQRLVEKRNVPAIETVKGWRINRADLSLVPKRERGRPKHAQ